LCGLFLRSSVNAKIKKRPSLAALLNQNLLRLWRMRRRGQERIKQNDHSPFVQVNPL
jgi:hypothetical protein